MADKSDTAINVCFVPILLQKSRKTAAGSADFGIWKRHHAPDRRYLCWECGFSVGGAWSFLPRRLRHASSNRWRVHDEFYKPAEVLRDRRERKLILCALRAA